jgi:hypothetical protein
VNLDAIHHRKRGERGIVTVCVFPIPEMMIDTILKGAQETETKAVNLLNQAKVKITLQLWDVIQNGYRNIPTHSLKPTTHSREGCRPP